MRVILSGGGTGGHIYPALALAEVIKQHDPDAEFFYMLGQNGGSKPILSHQLAWRLSNWPFKDSGAHYHWTIFKLCGYS